MKVTKRQLRQIIRESIVGELHMHGTAGRAYGRAHKPKKSRPRGPIHGVNVSDVMRAKPTIEEWTDILLGELEDEIPQLTNLPPAKRSKVVGEMTSGTISSLIGAMGTWVPRRKKSESDA